MRILNVVSQYWPYQGGAPNYVKEMSERFVEEGNEATVYTTNAWDLDYLFFSDRKSINPSDECVNGVQVRRFPVRHPYSKGFIRQVLGRLPFRGSRFLFRFPSAILPEMWSKLLARGRKFDLIHATPSPFYSLIYPAFLASRIWRRPFVFTPFVHTGTPRGDSQTAMHAAVNQIAIMKASDLVIVQSLAEKKVLVDKGVREEKVVILGMGVNPEDMEGGSAERFRLRHKISTDEKIVIYVGALIYDKGAFHAIDAIRRLKQQGGKVRLVMAGHPSVEFQQYFREQPSEVRGSCILVGNVGGQDKIDLFRACDILVLPSRADSYGIVFLEAWLMGKPVIGAYAGGLPEVISDGKDGFLIPFGDDHMLSEYICSILRSPELGRRMGQRGREKVLSSCTWSQRYRKVKGWFEELVGKE